MRVLHQLLVSTLDIFFLLFSKFKHHFVLALSYEEDIADF